MGNQFSKKNENLCNYNCPVCQKTDKIPNIAGRFFILDEQYCQCNACDTVFEKHLFYKNVSPDKVIEGIWIDK